MGLGGGLGVRGEVTDRCTYIHMFYRTSSSLDSLSKKIEINTKRVSAYNRSDRLRVFQFCLGGPGGAKKGFGGDGGWGMGV